MHSEKRKNTITVFEYLSSSLLIIIHNTYLFFSFSHLQADPSKPVLVAGDPERAHMKKVDEAGGIGYHINQVKNCNDLASKLKISPIKII